MTTDFQKGLVAGLSIGGLSVSSESSEEGTSNYNNLENKPISLNEDGEVVISEDYQEYFSSLEKDNDTIDYDEFINTPLSLSENGSVIINEAYKEFFKNLIKRAITELPIASSATLGGIKIGKGLTISEDGVLSVNLSSTAFSNDTILIATSAEILEDKNILINDTMVGDYLYSPSQIILINDTILGGLYTNG